MLLRWTKLSRNSAILKSLMNWVIKMTSISISASVHMSREHLIWLKRNWIHVIAEKFERLRMPLPPYVSSRLQITLFQQISRLRLTCLRTDSQSYQNELFLMCMFFHRNGLTTSRRRLDDALSDKISLCLCITEYLKPSGKMSFSVI